MRAKAYHSKCNVILSILSLCSNFIEVRYKFHSPSHSTIHTQTYSAGMCLHSHTHTHIQVYSVFFWFHFLFSSIRCDMSLCWKIVAITNKQLRHGERNQRACYAHSACHSAMDRKWWLRWWWLQSLPGLSRVAGDERSWTPIVVVVFVVLFLDLMPQMFH